MSWKRKVGIKAGEYLGHTIMKKVSDVTKELSIWASKNPLEAKNANPPNEDEYMEERNKAFQERRKQVYKDSQCARTEQPQTSRPPQPQMSHIAPMYREVSSWSKENLDSVMQSPEYWYDDLTQKK